MKKRKTSGRRRKESSQRKTTGLRWRLLLPVVMKVDEVERRSLHAVRPALRVLHRREAGHLRQRVVAPAGAATHTLAFERDRRVRIHAQYKLRLRTVLLAKGASCKAKHPPWTCKAEATKSRKCGRLLPVAVGAAAAPRDVLPVIHRPSVRSCRPNSTRERLDQIIERLRRCCDFCQSKHQALR